MPNSTETIRQPSGVVAEDRDTGRNEPFPQRRVFGVYKAGK
jgi:hypothetical protein